MNTDKVLLIFVAIGAFLIVLSSFSGATRFLTVLSGSMAPALNQGDLVVTSTVSPSVIQPGDVISFVSGEDRTIVTHRVVNVTSQGFVVKGDANNAPDASTVNTNNVIGKVAFSLPLAGYLFYFSKSVYGFLAFIVVPGVLIIINEAKKIKRSAKSAGKFGFSRPLLLIMILATLLMMNFGPTSAFFNDFEYSEGNFIALEPGACIVTNVTKWWSDTEFVPMSDPRYGDDFEIVFHNSTNTITSTNPGGFFININITNAPAITSLHITDMIDGNIKICDFQPHPKIANSVHVYEFYVIEDGSVDITKKFSWTFDGCVLNVELNNDITLAPSESIYVTFHVKYALTTLDDAETLMFPRNYTNKVYVTINGTLVLGGTQANITANLKVVDPEIEPTGFDASTMVMASGGGTAPIIEEPVVNEIIPDNPTIDPGANETLPGDNSTNETNTTEPGLNETTPVTYHIEAGPNAFLVPDTWATTAFQLAIDYPLILDISYVDAESNTVTYVANDPIDNSFDIVAGMTITINASEPFDMV
jgi:signal peptidase